jgi:hypothetical protein
MNPPTPPPSPHPSLHNPPHPRSRRDPTRRSVTRGLAAGTKQFAERVTLETLNTTHKLTKGIANTISTNVLNERVSLNLNNEVVEDNMGEVIASAGRGLSKMKQTIVLIPDVWSKKGPKEAVTLIPVAVMAGLGGISEAVAVSTVSARNILRPDLKREDEARRDTIL